MSILDLLFPKKCLGCSREGAYFCSQCLNRLSLNREEVCPVCEKASIGGLTHPRCLNSSSLDGLTSVFAYRGVIRRAIAQLKYKFISDLASDLVELLLSFCGENKTFTHICGQNPILIPVPLHPRRERWRGFNQSELLGKMIAENLGISFTPEALKRVKNTTSQTKLNAKERKINIQGAFTLSSNYQLPVTNYRVLLFDDVWTSGATLKEAAKVLKMAGAKKVWGLTLAR